MPLEIMAWDSEKDGVLNEANMRAKLEAMSCRVSVYVYPAGTAFPEHSHKIDKIDKIDGVLSGRFRISMSGQSVILEAGDMISIPCGIHHAAEVVGDADVVSLDGVKL